MMPSRSCNGARVEPVPGVLLSRGSRAIFSYGDRSPYARKGAPISLGASCLLHAVSVASPAPNARKSRRFRVFLLIVPAVYHTNTLPGIANRLAFVEGDLAVDLGQRDFAVDAFQPESAVETYRFGEQPVPVELTAKDLDPGFRLRHQHVLLERRNRSILADLNPRSYASSEDDTTSMSRIGFNKVSLRPSANSGSPHTTTTPGYVYNPTGDTRIRTSLVSTRRLRCPTDECRPNARLEMIVACRTVPPAIAYMRPL